MKEFSCVKTDDQWTKSDSVDRSETGCIYSICLAGYVHSRAKSSAYVNSTTIYNLTKLPIALFREYIVVILRVIFDSITLWHCANGAITSTDTCINQTLLTLISEKSFVWMNFHIDTYVMMQIIIMIIRPNLIKLSPIAKYWISNV